MQDAYRINPPWFREHFGKKDREDTARPKETPDRAASNETSSLIVVYEPSRFEVHVSYSGGLENGPVIERPGDASPVMADPGIIGRYTMDADEQRIGAYYITEETRRSHIRKVFYSFTASLFFHKLLDRKGAASRAREVLLDHLGDVPKQFRELLQKQSALGIGGLTTEVSGFIEPFEEFLKDQEITVDGLFPERSADQIEIKSVLDDVYKSYRNVADDFAEHRKKRGFCMAVTSNMKKFLRLLITLIKTPSHQTIVNQIATNKGQQLVLMQGCGDLTMNEWNVAFASGDSFRESRGMDEASVLSGSEERSSAATPNGKTASERWALLHARDEPLNDRAYTCLIKWSCGRDSDALKRIAKRHRVVYPYQIATLRFMVHSLDVGRPPNRHVFLVKGSGTGIDEQRKGPIQLKEPIGQLKEPIGHLIEFAVYGQQLYRNGDPVRPQSVVRELGDIRHMYKLPNLNPEAEDKGDEDYLRIETEDVGIPEYNERPRNLFDQITRDDVWLGEALLKDRNLRVAALTQPVRFDVRGLGAPKEWIDIVLRREEKHKTYFHSDSEQLDIGQWRWVSEGRDSLLEIYLRINEYPCGMVGVKAEDQSEKVGIINTEKLFFLAHGHNHGWNGCSIVEAAQFLRGQDSYDILLFDEGDDVFQMVLDPQTGKWGHTVPLKRNQLRCVFWASIEPSKPTSAGQQAATRSRARRASRSG